MDLTDLQLGTRNLWSCLVDFLSKYPEWLNAKVKFFLPNMDLGSRTETPDPAQEIILQLSRLHAQSLATWQAFIHCVCMELDVPLELEVPLLSTWGREDGFPSQLGTDTEGCPNSRLHPGLKRPHQSCGSSPHRKQYKKQQLELARQYLQLLKTSTQQLYGSGHSGPGQPLSLHITPILQRSRVTTPLDTQEEAVMGDLKAEDSIQDLFNTKAEKGRRVTVVLGKAGMGKTTLAHWLCQKWAAGQLDRFQAVFLFEFRQLNLITGLLTLPQLLFDLYLSPTSGAATVFQYLEEYAHHVLLIFDGLDEALYPCSSKKTKGPDAPGPTFSLFSGLCDGSLLPGCWVLTTSRPGKLPACLPVEATMVHMWGFDRPRVEEYVGRFFRDQPLQAMALAEVRADRNLWSMCTVPALCRVACLCLQHLLPGTCPGQAATLLPTITQLYVQMVLTLSPHRCPPTMALLDLGDVALKGLEAGKVVFYARDILPPVMAFGAAHNLLTSFCVRTDAGRQETGYAFTHLSLQEFFAALQLMASPKVDRDMVSRYVTLHSYWVLRTNTSLGLLDHLPTFLAGLASCACRPFLSHLSQQDEAWIDAKQAAVVQTLRKLATRRFRGPKVMKLCHCVSETQEPGLARLAAQSLNYPLTFHNFPLTYADLAALANILSYRDAPIQLDFEGCPLEPHCPEALVDCGQVENLSFKSRKCGDAFAEALSRSLPTMKGLEKLGLTGSKITAKGISHLVKALSLCPQLEEVSLQNNQLKDLEVLNIMEVLPHLPRLRKLDLSRNDISVSTLLSLAEKVVMCPTIRVLQARQAELLFLFSPSTETAAEPQGNADLQGNANRKEEAQTRSLTLRFHQCQLQAHDTKALIALLRDSPHLEEVDLSGNQLEDEGCQLIAEAVPQLHIARKLDLSDNRLSASGVHCVLSAMSACLTLAELHISLLHKTVVLKFAQELEEEEEEGTQKRAAFLDNLLPQVPSELSLSSRRIRLTHCGFQAKHLEQLCKALEGHCHVGRLHHLDLSGNALGDEGATLLARLLPGLGTLQSLNLSENGLSLDAVFYLVQLFSTLEWIFHLDISLQSQCCFLRGDRRRRDALVGGPLPECPAGAQSLGFAQHCDPRSFRLRECQLEPSNLTRLCGALKKCPGPLEVELSCEVLSDHSLDTLLHCLPWLPQLSLLELSQTGLSPGSPLLLANIFNLCPRVQKVELRSLHHASLHFRSSEELQGVCCRFSACSLRQGHVEPLCRLLSKCEDFRQLDLSANLLGDDGLRNLMECLPQMPISDSLDLSHNHISLESALYLVETLPSCPRARQASVNLGSEQSFWVHFSRREEAEKTLRLSECSFGPEHVPRLATGLSQASQLTELTLTQCGLGLEQLTVLLRLVRRPAGLLRLRVQEPWVGRVGVLALLGASTQASGNITEISISETQQQLCVQLEFPRQEENAEAVALRLAQCDLGTHHSLLVTQLMETCAKLRQLSLSQVNLCDTSSLLLQSLLPSFSELRKFRLTSSCVSFEGLTHVASGLSHCHDLEEVDLSNNQFSEEGTKELVGTLEGKFRLKRLDLSSLPLGGWTLDVLTQGLSHMTLLQSLVLSRNGMGDIGCYHLSEALRSATSLEELSLSHNQIGDVGAQHLAAVLPGLPELRKIDFSANGIGPAGGVQLAESLSLCRRLEELRLGCNALEDPTAQVLARGLPLHLRVLRLSSSRLGPEGAMSLCQALDGCPQLEELSLAENSLAGGLPLFSEGLPLLKQIDLISCEIDNQTATLLAASFVLCPALEEILLSWNLLGDEAAAQLACVLPQMSRLKRVDLEKNRITAYGAWLLAEGLAQRPGIQVIRLWNNPIPSDMAQRLQSQEPRLDFAFFEDYPQALQST
ncbi:protein NLRC5 [Orycteropus afer afer]|uniref:Protein NLRC5 n=1 Tax=Orycteropus afer afer TaxID=1230840 RepID=A0AC54Z4A9_ORYAF|nr:protein NLRC5 [Orycteropus afer afer]